MNKATNFYSLVACAGRSSASATGHQVLSFFVMTEMVISALASTLSRDLREIITEAVGVESAGNLVMTSAPAAIVLKSSDAAPPVFA